MKSLFSAALLLPSLAFTPSFSTKPVTCVPADLATWQIDPAHSELTFRIRHYVTRVCGTFAKWQGTIVADPKSLSGGPVQVSIYSKGIDTNNERRDTHLKSNDSLPPIPLRLDCAVAESGEVCVRVSDTGPGIAPEQRVRFFHPFVRVDALRTRTQEGTGLGLAISRTLARGMGGEISLESELGTGSTFILTLLAS